jgi:hypothetical protein
LEKAAFNFRPKGKIPPAAEPVVPEFDERHPASTPNPRAAAPLSSLLRVQSSAHEENLIWLESSIVSRMIVYGVDFNE